MLKINPKGIDNTRFWKNRLFKIWPKRANKLVRILNYMFN